MRRIGRPIRTELSKKPSWYETWMLHVGVFGGCATCSHFFCGIYVSCLQDWSYLSDVALQLLFMIMTLCSICSLIEAIAGTSVFFSVFAGMYKSPCAPWCRRRVMPSTRVKAKKASRLIILANLNQRPQLAWTALHRHQRQAAARTLR